MRDDWDRHWQDYHEMNARNPANAWRRALIFAALGDAPERLADVGCGQGDFLVAARAAHPGARLLGVDVSAAGLQISQAKLPDARFVQWDLTGGSGPPPEAAGWATHAVCSEVLEHVDDPVAALRNAAGLLAPGGKLVVTVPGGPMSAFDRHIGHRRHFSPAALADMFAAAGLRTVWTRGAGFPFFNLYRLVVIARGRRVISDAAGDRPPPLAARAALAAFDRLFKLNLDTARLGWQVVGVAERT